MNKREQAKALLVGYFEMVSAGGLGDYDSQSEIESIVDLIVEAAVEQVLKEIKGDVHQLFVERLRI